MGYTIAMRGYIWAALFFVLVPISGCGGGAMKYVNPNANFSYIKNLAIIPFNNFSADRYAGEKVRSVLMVDILSRHTFEVVEQGQVTKVLASVLGEAGVQEGRVAQLDTETLKVLGEKLGVQALMLGSVDEYRAGRGGSAVSISLRLIDTSSGIVLWQVKSTVLGSSNLRRIVGLDNVDATLLTRRAVKRALDTLL